MPVIDLSHTIAPSMPVYPGTPAPSVAPARTVREDGHLEHAIALHTHVGTHVDAPAHLLEDGDTLDGVALERFAGRAIVVDARSASDGRITQDRIAAERTRLVDVDIVLLWTGWSARWGTPGYLEGFPCLDEAAARWLVDRGVRGLGVDTISVDPMAADPLAVHHALLDRGAIIIENLTGLDVLPRDPFLFVALPLKIAGGDGSPVRAAAFT
ncbi:cyclase family protein [bacterium]|nr:cyclase family protein [bacterium]